MNIFGDKYISRIHSTSKSKKEGTYGKNYISFSIKLPLKEETFINPKDGIEKTILVESSVIVEFTFDDNGLVKYYFVGQYEEPSSD